MRYRVHLSPIYFYYSQKSLTLVILIEVILYSILTSVKYDSRFRNNFDISVKRNYISLFNRLFLPKLSLDQKRSVGRCQIMNTRIKCRYFGRTGFRTILINNLRSLLVTRPAHLSYIRLIVLLPVQLDSSVSAAR